MLKLEHPAPLIVEDLRKLFHPAVILLSKQEILFLLGYAFVYEQIVVILSNLKVTGKHRSHA